MASFRDFEFETVKKIKKLEKSKTTNQKLANINPFHTYKIYNTERNKSKNKINSSKDSNRVTDSGKFKAIIQNYSLPVDEDIDSHQPTRVEQQELEINKGKLLEPNNLAFKIDKVEIKKENISPKPESLSANSKIISQSKFE
jgi:hypothetical protein